METVNDMREMKATIHYGDEWPNNIHYGGATGMDPGQWQELTMLWSRKQIIWYLNGRQYWSALSGNGTRNGWFSTGGSGPDSPFDTKFHLIVNLAIGGGLTGNVPPEAAAATLAQPRTMHIDYIRVYGR